MSIVIWTVSIGVLATVLWFLVKVIVGLTVSPQITGRHYLKQQLKKIGIDVTTFPDPCIDEFVRIAVNTVNMRTISGKEKFNTNFLTGLDTMADVILLWFSDPNDSMFRSFGGEKNVYRDILERYEIRPKP